MKIGINTRNLISGKMEGFGRYTYELTKRIVLNHPEHTFYFFFDRKFDPQFVFAENVIPIVVDPPARHPVLWYIWFELRLGKVLKKYAIDVFWSPDGFINLRTEVPQIATIHDINFHVYPKDLPTSVSYYYNRFFPKFARKADKIITVSNFSKSELIKYYELEPTKIEVIYNSADEIFKPISEQEIKNTRSLISGTKPYFLFVGSLHPRKNLQRLLNAYSIFAKENNTIDLVIVGSPLWKKHRIKIPEDCQNRIHFTGYVDQEQLAKITGSAYALTYLTYYEGFGIPLVEAMKCGVPIVAAYASCLPEITGEAALLCDPFSEKEAANQLKFLLDNRVYQEFSEKSISKATSYSWDKAAIQTWEVIAGLYNQKKS